MVKYVVVIIVRLMNVYPSEWNNFELATPNVSLQRETVYS